MEGAHIRPRRRAIKNPRNNRGYMERVTRFELATATLATWGSTTELHPQSTLSFDAAGFKMTEDYCQAQMVQF